MLSLALLAVLASGEGSQCANPPSRASDAYWDYVDSCGCANLDPVSRASQDWDRFSRACRQWRERNPQVNVVIVASPAAPSPSPAASPTPRPTPRIRATPTPSASPSPSPR